MFDFTKAYYIACGLLNEHQSQLVEVQPTNNVFHLVNKRYRLPKTRKLFCQPLTAAANWSSPP